MWTIFIYFFIYPADVGDVNTTKPPHQPQIIRSVERAYPDRAACFMAMEAVKAQNKPGEQIRNHAVCLPAA